MEHLIKEESQRLLANQMRDARLQRQIQVRQQAMAWTEATRRRFEDAKEKEIKDLALVVTGQVQNAAIQNIEELTRKNDLAMAELGMAHRAAAGFQNVERLKSLKRLKNETVAKNRGSAAMVKHFKEREAATAKNEAIVKRKEQVRKSEDKLSKDLISRRPLSVSNSNAVNTGIPKNIGPPEYQQSIAKTLRVASTRKSQPQSTISHLPPKGPISTHMKAKVNPKSKVAKDKKDAVSNKSSSDLELRNKRQSNQKGILEKMARIKASSPSQAGLNLEAEDFSQVKHLYGTGIKLRHKYMEVARGTPQSLPEPVLSKVRYFDATIPKSEVQYLAPDGLSVKESRNSPDAWEKGRKSSQELLLRKHQQALKEEEVTQKAAERGKMAMKKAILEKQLTEVKNELLDEVDFHLLGTGQQTAILGLEDDDDDVIMEIPKTIHHDSQSSDEFSEVDSEEGYVFPTILPSDAIPSDHKLKTNSLQDLDDKVKQQENALQASPSAGSTSLSEAHKGKRDSGSEQITSNKPAKSPRVKSKDKAPSRQRESQETDHSSALVNPKIKQIEKSASSHSIDSSVSAHSKSGSAGAPTLAKLKKLKKRSSSPTRSKKSTDSTTSDEFSEVDSEEGYVFPTTLPSDRIPSEHKLKTNSLEDLDERVKQQEKALQAPPPPAGSTSLSEAHKRKRDSGSEKIASNSNKPAKSSRDKSKDRTHSQQPQPHSHSGEKIASNLDKPAKSSRPKSKDRTPSVSSRQHPSRSGISNSESDQSSALFKLKIRQIEESTPSHSNDSSVSGNDKSDSYEPSTLVNLKILENSSSTPTRSKKSTSSTASDEFTEVDAEEGYLFPITSSRHVGPSDHKLKTNSLEYLDERVKQQEKALQAPPPVGSTSLSEAHKGNRDSRSEMIASNLNKPAKSSRTKRNDKTPSQQRQSEIASNLNKPAKSSRMKSKDRTPSSPQRQSPQSGVSNSESDQSSALLNLKIRQIEESTPSHSNDSSVSPHSKSDSGEASTLVNLKILENSSSTPTRSEKSTSSTTDYYSPPDGPFTSTPDGKLHPKNTLSTSDEEDSIRSVKRRALYYYLDKFLKRRPGSIEKLPVSSSSSSGIRADSDVLSSDSFKNSTTVSRQGSYTQSSLSSNGSTPHQKRLRERTGLTTLREEIGKSDSGSTIAETAIVARRNQLTVTTSSGFEKNESSISSHSGSSNGVGPASSDSLTGLLRVLSNHQEIEKRQLEYGVANYSQRLSPSPTSHHGGGEHNQSNDAADTSGDSIPDASAILRRLISRQAVHESSRSSSGSSPKSGPDIEVNKRVELLSDITPVAFYETPPRTKQVAANDTQVISEVYENLFDKLNNLRIEKPPWVTYSNFPGTEDN